MAIKLALRRIKTVSTKKIVVKKRKVKGKYQKKSKKKLMKTCKHKVSNMVSKSIKNKSTLTSTIQRSVKSKKVKVISKAKTISMNQSGKSYIVKTSASVIKIPTKNTRISPRKIIGNKIQRNGINSITPIKNLVKSISPNQSLYELSGSSVERNDGQPKKNELVLVEDENKGLNESTVIEPLISEIIPIKTKKISMNHYYEIQEVFCSLEDDDKVLNLTDIGLFDKFEVAREHFIQDVSDKIENGCKPVRANTFSCSRLRDALNASKSSIFGYWFRLRDPENGVYEMFLRKKKWSPFCGERSL